MNDKLILIADDDPRALELLRIRLVAAGYRVASAGDAYQAVETARREPPSLIILDINMPAGDGFSVAERLAKIEQAASIPVLYVTGDRSDSTMLHAVESGAHGVIHKPYDTAYLLARIESVLDRAAASGC